MSLNNNISKIFMVNHEYKTEKVCLSQTRTILNKHNLKESKYLEIRCAYTKGNGK